MKRKKESGVLVVEAAIVVTVVMMFIAVLLYMSMIFYQQSLVSVAANQTAADIAQLYGSTTRDPFTGYVDAAGVNEAVTYTSLASDAYTNTMREKADAAAKYRLRSARVLNTGTPEVTVSIQPRQGELLRNQVIVTVTDTYKVPFVSFFGVEDNQLTFKATGRANCTDLLDYLSGVPAMGTTDGNAVVFLDECTLNFYKHRGDTGRPYKTMTVLKGNTVNGSQDYSHSVWPANPSQDKMRFIGWVTEAGAAFTAETPVSGDSLNVYGKWAAKLTFDPDGGTINGQPGLFVDENAIVGDSYPLPIPVRPGCTFDGWYTKKNGEGERFDGGLVTGDLELFAKWTCRVTFHDTARETWQSESFVCGTKLSKYAEKLGLSAPIFTGCTFSGWFTEAEGAGTRYNNDTVITKDVTLYTYWTCKVTFDANGGTGAPAERTYKYKQMFGSVAEPTKQYYLFKGWKGNDGKTYTDTTAVTKNVKLTAQWTKCEHKAADQDHIEVHEPTNCQDIKTWKNKCRVCGFVSEIQKNSNVRGPHKKAIEKVTPATCLKKGQKTYHCTVSGCSHIFTEDTVEIKALGHDWGKWVVTTTATCTRDGNQRRECKRCGTPENATIKQLKHAYQKATIKETCTEKGYTIDKKCTMCGKEKGSKYNIKDALGHSFKGHCGQKHEKDMWLDITEKHKTEAHNAVWGSCTVCIRCGIQGSYNVLCGTHYDKWGLKKGWPGYTYKELHGENQLSG